MSRRKDYRREQKERRRRVQKAWLFTLLAGGAALYIGLIPARALGAEFKLPWRGRRW